MPDSNFNTQIGQVTDDPLATLDFGSPEKTRKLWGVLGSDTMSESGKNREMIYSVSR